MTPPSRPYTEQRTEPMPVAGEVVNQTPLDEPDIPLEQPEPGHSVKVYEPSPAARAVEGDALEVADLVQQHKKIEEAMSQVMRSGLHYGYIEREQRDGTVKRISQKPMLFKPGAEVLCKLFHLRPHYEELGSVHKGEIIAYRMRCVLTHFPTGVEIAEGLGSANSREKAQILTMQKRSVSAWDLDNDLLKMACKRALMAAILVGTAASDVFSHEPPEKTSAELHRILNGRAKDYDRTAPREDGASWVDWSRGIANERWGVDSRADLDEEQLQELIGLLDQEAIPF